MNGLILDTNIAIDILNGKQDIIKKCFSYYPIYLPIVVCGELLFGALNSSKVEQNIKKYQNFIDDCTVLNTTTTVAVEYANIRKELKKIGRPIPENDIWIAALCISYQIPLVTRDKHFVNIKKLQLIALD